MRRIVALATAASVFGVLAVGGLTAVASSGAPALPTLTLALNGKTVVVGGSTVSGAVNIQTTVTGESLGGSLLFRMADGVSPSLFPQAIMAVRAHHGDLNYLDPYGSIVFHGVSPKGTSSAQTVLAPGTYFAVDDGARGSAKPHTLFTVAASAQPASLPKPQATISMIDFGFTGPTTLHDGELVRFQNDGFVVHMDFWLSVKNLTAAKQVVKLLLAGKDNQAGKLATNGAGFAGPLSSGGMQQLVITEKPGIYVQFCFMNTQDGREHTRLGMEQIFKIVK